jgi:hypothetical protein
MPMDICREKPELQSIEIIRCSRGKARGVYELELVALGVPISLTIFTGRESYRPWAELSTTAYSEKAFEAIRDTIAWVKTVIGESGRIMITYTWDKETAELLDRGIHPGATRLGAILIESGYYIVRNMWYHEALWEELEILKSYIDKDCNDEKTWCRWAKRSAGVLKVVLQGVASRHYDESNRSL